MYMYIVIVYIYIHTYIIYKHIYIYMSVCAYYLFLRPEALVWREEMCGPSGVHKGGFSQGGLSDL